MGFLARTEYSVSYNVQLYSITFLLLALMYIFILLGPFFGIKISEYFWPLSKIYYEQPWVSLNGEYLISCDLGSETYFYSNIEPYNLQNTPTFSPSLSIRQEDTNRDNNWDKFEVSIQFYGDSTLLNQCKIFLNSDVGLRNLVRLQMQSPVYFLVQSFSGLSQAKIYGDLIFFQKAAIGSGSITINDFNSTFYSESGRTEDLMKNYYERNESLSTNYRVFTHPGSADIDQIQILMYLNVPGFQSIRYIPQIMENLRSFWVQYIFLFIPVYVVCSKLINFGMRQRIFQCKTQNNLPKGYYLKK